MTSFISHPVPDDLEKRPAPERLRLTDGMLLTQKHFRDEQLYNRGQVSRLAMHLHGAGTVAGLNVTIEPASGENVEIKVAPGMALDRLGRIVEIQMESCLNIAKWIDQQSEDDLTRGAIDAGLRSASGSVPEHIVIDVYLSFHACARTPEPAFASPNADKIDGVNASRVLDTGLLSIVVRPDGDDKEPSSRVASKVSATPDIAEIRNYKRVDAWKLFQTEVDPFKLPPNEHVIAGNRQDGSEVLLARITLPVITAGASPQFDSSIDMSQTAFAPNQDIRPYSYSADELALLLAQPVRR